MRVAFLIERRNFYRVLGPVVDRALERGYATECWHDWGQPRTGPKASEFPDPAPTFRHGQPTVRTYRGATDLPRLIGTTPPDVMVALRQPTPAEKVGRVRWFGLQYTLDVAELIDRSGATRSDGIGLHSVYWRERTADSIRIMLHNRARGTRTPPPPVDDAAVMTTLRHRATLVGTPEMDQCHWIDPGAVRQRLGLDPTRPVVLYIPFPFASNPQTFWVRHVYGAPSGLWQGLAIRLGQRPEYREHVARGWSDRAVVAAVRSFCDANGAALIVKARSKDPVPRYLAQRADRVLYDDTYYPATILELMKIASLCLHFFSTAAYEAAYAGVPSICVAPSPEDLGFWPIWRDLFLNLDEGGSFNFPGVVYPRSLGEFLEGFARSQMADYPLEPAARAQYVEKFVGFEDGKAADRLLDAAHSLVDEAERQ